MKALVVIFTLLFASLFIFGCSADNTPVTKSSSGDYADKAVKKNQRPQLLLELCQHFTHSIVEDQDAMATYHLK